MGQGEGGMSQENSIETCILSLSLHNLYTQYIKLEMLGWMKHKLESRLQGETSATSDIQMTPCLSRKQSGTKETLDEGERGE